MKFISKLSDYISSVVKNYANIPLSRKHDLENIAESISRLKMSREDIQLVFICTHNSRRSHFAQIWAQIAAIYFDKAYISTYSGGTEATAFNKNSIAALIRSGFEIKNETGSNPHYDIIYSEDNDKMHCFSKHYSDSANPKQDYIAIMVCSDADQNCPFIPEALLRISLPFEDPKKSDGSGNEVYAYDFTCMEIATQMFYLVSKID